MKPLTSDRLVVGLILMTLVMTTPLLSQLTAGQQALDKKVESFLERHKGNWHDMNVPESDGKLLHDLVLKDKYKRALEIGTSTGRSAIWLAWALSKTGGKLITIEIDEDRYQTALANFQEAGLAEYIDARLADAHELVPQLEGPFDFVFCDADKNWTKNYFLALEPKLEVGGRFTVHNVSSRGRGGHGTGEFLEHVLSLADYDTTIDDTGGGLSISLKKPVD